jgi:alcohol dehydrogenase class IV
MEMAQDLRGTYWITGPRRVLFGPGAVSELPGELERHGGRRALILTGRTLATETPLVGRVREALGERCAGVFAGIATRSPVETVLAALVEARRLGADSLVSLGGSSVSDAGKLVALCLAEGVETAEALAAYGYAVFGSRGLAAALPRPIPPTPPHIAIPTTLSVGEFTCSGSAMYPGGEKMGFTSESLAVRAVILDPEITVHTPDWLWLSTAVRALDHAVEGLYSRAFQPMADTLALEAIRLLFRHLPRSTGPAGTLADREQCQIAGWFSIYGGLLVNGREGLSHAIGHRLGAVCEVPHGYTSCVSLPAAMAFNLPVTAPQQAAIARAAGVAADGCSEEALAAEAAPAVRALIGGLGLPTRLRDVGVTREQFPAICEGVLGHFGLSMNPRPVTGAEDVLSVLEAAF